MAKRGQRGNFSAGKFKSLKKCNKNVTATISKSESSGNVCDICVIDGGNFSPPYIL